MTELTDTERETLADLAFDLDEKYHLGFTNSPDMHPGAPEIADFSHDLTAAVEAIITARLARIEAECERANARGDIHVPVARLHAALAAPTPDEVQP